MDSKPTHTHTHNHTHIQSHTYIHTRTRQSSQIFETGRASSERVSECIVSVSEWKCKYGVNFVIKYIFSPIITRSANGYSVQLTEADVANGTF